jgi:very-short-patch-repair endonuclease
MTLPEVVLWRWLRGGKLKGLRFRRQHPIGPYILDFYCPAVRLAVEVEGVAHDNVEQVRHDERRVAWLAKRNISVLRVAANDVLKDEKLEGVLLAITQAAAPSTAFGGPPPPLRGGGSKEWVSSEGTRGVSRQGR